MLLVTLGLMDWLRQITKSKLAPDRKLLHCISLLTVPRTLELKKSVKKTPSSRAYVQPKTDKHNEATAGVVSCRQRISGQAVPGTTQQVSTLEQTIYEHRADCPLYAITKSGNESFIFV